jgi:hypothetical protein
MTFTLSHNSAHTVTLPFKYKADESTKAKPCPLPVDHLARTHGARIGICPDAREGNTRIIADRAANSHRPQAAVSKIDRCARLPAASLTGDSVHDHAV